MGLLPFLIAVIDANAACDGKQCGHRCELDGDKNYRFGLCNQDGECVKGGELNCATCPTVTVLRVYGDAGEYFEFSAKEFSEMVGFDDWGKDVYRIVQSGSHSWEGMVRVQIRKDNGTPFGRRAFNGAKDAWKVGDTISLKSCVNPDITPCKDVTFGECDIPKYKVLSKTSQQNIQSCNSECNDTYNCTTYSYNKQTKECTLTTNERGDYRARCNIRAVPVDKFIDDCIWHINDQVCDSHLEQDCEYNGEVLTRYEPGRIASDIDCEIRCKIFAPDCKYWIYHNREAVCIHKRDGRKTCNGLGGPKKPSYDHC